MILGFTGTQSGRTPEQIKAWDKIFNNNIFMEVESVIHGMCHGVDTEINEFYLKNTDVQIIGYPGTHEQSISMKVHKQQPIQPFLSRNKNIVENCDWLIAFPKLMYEELRSGTWATIRYARKQNRQHLIIYPNGKLEWHT